MAKAARTVELGTESRQPPARPIDLVHLAKQCLGDEGLEREVLGLYSTSIATFLSRLQQAQSFDDLSLNLHSIKGASSGVGAWTVADMAKAMEDELRAARPLTSERIEDLALVIEDVRGFIGRMLETAA
jgi:HPt (histidine-containing phosphotransfer) domain-containing protein